MFNTTKICPSCHQKKVQTSDKLTPSGSFVWEIYRVIILFVPTIIIVNWSKFLTLAQNTQTGFFFGFLLIASAVSYTHLTLPTTPYV